MSTSPGEELWTGAREERPEFYVVGVGASAGGLEALEQFFDHQRPDCGMAFVVIQHLSPDFKSLMNELLSRHTELRIYRAEHEMIVEPNAIYLLPPKKEMVISQGRLLLTDMEPTRGLTLPIDVFFKSLALDFGDRSIGVILSGTGSDGSRGVRAIHDAGGLVLVQSPETAKFDGMPRSSLDTDVADHVVPPVEMANILLGHVGHGKYCKPEVLPVAKDDMQAVFQILQAEYAIDFTHYKPSTVLRRVERRLQLNRNLDLEQYVRRLESDPTELNRLYRDLLIGVTRFFRDQEAFQRVEQELLPQMLEHVPERGEFRAWVAGTATGEEAYSLAMIIHECCERLQRQLEVKIFATDVHRASLDIASAGVYDEESLSNISTQRRNRYFMRNGHRYQVIPALRQLIVFAPHNIIRDAPFTKLDFISCRNLLIYFQPLTQKRVLSLLHFALRRNGVLFLGPSESPGEITEEFEPLDKQWRIYRKRRDSRLASEFRLPTTAAYSGRTAGLSRAHYSGGTSDPHLLRAYDVLLDEFVPPSFLITEDHKLVHTFAGAGKLLQVPDGRTSVDLFEMLDRDIRLGLATLLQRASKKPEPVLRSRIRHETESGQVQSVTLSVRPVVSAALDNKYYLLTVQHDDLRLPVIESAVEFADAPQEGELQVRQLEHELRYTQENLQATLEEMEASNEELQATNEELVASNEELQSTNEELHSVNEELYTVNAEYQRKIVELTELNDDMDNLFRSTDMGTIFLDQDLRIRKFTPKISEQFRILPQDAGRSIEAFSHTIDRPELLHDVRNVLETRQPMEYEVADYSGGQFLLRILPYQTQHRIAGVVLTLIDISSLRRTEDQLRLMSKVFQDGADPIIIEDMEGQILEVNHEAARIYGFTREQMVGRHVEILVPPECREQSRRLRLQCRETGQVRSVETKRMDGSGQARPILLTLSLLSGRDGRAEAIATIAKDITVQKHAEEQARLALMRRDQFLAMLSHELRNPLHAIRGSATLIKHDGADESVRAQASSIVERQARHMSRLLDDLLDVSRITQGKIELVRESVDLCETIQEVAQLVDGQVQQHRHQLVLQLPPKPVVVEGDPVRLLQVMENLMTNAVKYTPAKGLIEVKLREIENEAVISVRDEGIGIRPDMLEQIFDLFVQSDASLDRSDGGMGVGLTLVHKIVELHGGSITAHSDGPGTGSQFSVRLPVSGGTRRRLRVDKTNAVRAPRVRCRVLVVEDNEDSRKMLRTLLELDGYEVWTASDGPQGLAAVEKYNPHVALIDIGIPGINGFELAQRIRQRGHHGTKLIAVTGYGRSEDREAVYQAGFDDHLLKPIDPDVLEAALQKVNCSEGSPEQR